MGEEPTQTNIDYEQLPPIAQRVQQTPEEWPRVDVYAHDAADGGFSRHVFVWLALIAAASGIAIWFREN